VTEAERIQAYIRATGARIKDVVPSPPFTALFHPRNAMTYLNFAVPDGPAGGDLSGPLTDLVALFRSRDRAPRIEYVEAFAPELGPALEQFGFELELRTPVMVCDRESARPAPEVPGLRIAQLTPDSPLDEVQTLITVGRRAFGAGNEAPASEADADEDRGRLDRDISVLGYLDSEPVAVAHAMEPVDGLAEIGGIGTLTEFRTRGIAGALTAEVTRIAFAAGAEIAYLTPGDEGAFRVYERAGYRVAETMRFYRLPGST
jgi:ribosomal protein S18 acetylase RimI-like enzyme